MICFAETWSHDDDRHVVAAEIAANASGARDIALNVNSNTGD